MDRWREMLREARQRRSLSQYELATLGSLSVETVRGYESGRRSPKREHLVALIDAMKLERSERNLLLEDAGFSNDAWHLSTYGDADFFFSIEQALAEVEGHRWPAFVNNEWSEVVVANRVAQRLWGVDLRHEYADPIDRNLLSVASTPRFAERVENWDEAIGTLVAVWKGHHRGPEKIEAPSPYFAAVMERFMHGDPKYVARFLTLWQNVEGRTPKVRWWYPVVWSEPGIGRLTFRCFATTADEPNGLAFNDWIPADAATWLGLERLSETAPDQSSAK